MWVKPFLAQVSKTFNQIFFQSNYTSIFWSCFSTRWCQQIWPESWGLSSHLPVNGVTEVAREINGEVIKTGFRIFTPSYMKKPCLNISRCMDHFTKMAFIFHLILIVSVIIYIWIYKYIQLLPCLFFSSLLNFLEILPKQSPKPKTKPKSKMRIVIRIGESTTPW